MSGSNMTSPPPLNPFSPDNSTFDFLQFMGIDSTSGSATSPFAVTEAGPSKSKDTDDESRSTSSRGRAKGRNGRHTRGARSTSSAREAGMEVDTSMSGVVPFGPSQVLGMPKNTGRNDFGLGGLLGQGHGNIEFDNSQVTAQQLQQQLEHIHMQSPLIFDPNNPNNIGNTTQSPFLPMSQMFMTSPMNGFPQLPEASMSKSESAAKDDEELKRRISMMNAYGMITPAQSSEMFPQNRMDHMSPMQLEMLARNDKEFNLTPMLSPALPNQQSMQNSPVNNNSFAQSQAPTNGNKSPLEQLQEQQRQFQQQLLLLQQQQKELEATAAAVAAASAASNSNSAANSPYQSMQPAHRLATTPGLHGPHSAGSINTPSPGYFSPLTSPALDGGRMGHFSQQPFNRPAHPLSALSSPALNPVGSSGGAQQTLSPALGPQSNNDMSDPDYLRALVSAFDGQQQQQQDQQQISNASQTWQSPAMPPSHQSSPLVTAVSSGPHRHSLPAKSRPSPMMKPTNHRSHHAKQVSTSGQFSMPTSPAIQRVVSQAVPGMGYLPPAAFQPQHGSASGTMTSQSALSHSTPSTPSPVDLNQLMPPPPVPAGTKAKSMAPMTPASLMNLGRATNGSLGDISEATTPVVEDPPTKRQAVRTTTSTSATSSTKVAAKKVVAQASRKGDGNRIPPRAAGKRALAMRPAGDVGVKAATKAAAAAAALPPPEGENRKTSHKAAEQKRRDSLKAGFDELRLLLPPINTEALDPESGEPIPGSSAPRLLPKSSLVPDDNPNRGVSKVALLKFSNEYIVRLHDKVDKRDDYIERLRMEVQRLRDGGAMDEVRGEDGEDLLEMDMLEGEEDEFDEDNGDEEQGDEDALDEDEDEGMEEDEEEWTATSRRKSGRKESNGRRPSLPKRSSSSTVKGRSS